MRKNIPVGISFNPDIYAVLRKMRTGQTRSKFVNECVREKLGLLVSSTTKPEGVSNNPPIEALDQVGPKEATNPAPVIDAPVVDAPVIEPVTVEEKELTFKST